MNNELYVDDGLLEEDLMIEELRQKYGGLGWLTPHRAYQLAREHLSQVLQQRHVPAEECERLLDVLHQETFGLEPIDYSNMSEKSEEDKPMTGLEFAFLNLAHVTALDAMNDSDVHNAIVHGGQAAKAAREAFEKERDV